MAQYLVLEPNPYNDARGRAKFYEKGDRLETSLDYGALLVEAGYVRVWTDDDERADISDVEDLDTLVASKALPPRPDEVRAWREQLKTASQEFVPAGSSDIDFEDLEILDTEIDAPDILPKHEPLSATPAAERLALDLGIDLESVAGTGSGGRITKGDVHRAAEELE